MEIVLLDTNILIEILKGDQKTIHTVQTLNAELAISSITAMELYYGALNKRESNRLAKFISLFRVIEINETISKQATTLVRSYAKSHNLDIPDSLIAATALTVNTRLLTYNTKDFHYIEGIRLI